MIVALLNALTCLALLPGIAGAPQVKFGKTTLVGRDTPLGLEFFGGIPFAEPPLGALRLQPPVLKVELNVSSFNATSFGPGCLQPPVGSNSSEDCLTINILRPAGTTARSSLPVMAWIYGGGFVGGASSTFDGTTFVTQSVNRSTPIIYVNFNYRLGPLGFPQGNEAARRGALNLGLKDQLAALEWIQHNIGAFGGDKKKVTVFGESAGAVSIGFHLLNPSFGNLARAAILESGSAGTTLLFDAASRQVDWDNFVRAVPECASKAASANTFDCIRNTTSSNLLQATAVSLAEANEQFPWVPTLDGPGGLIPNFPSLLWKQGRFARIPFISGTNLDEGTAFTPQTINSSQTIRDGIIANYTPSLLGQPALEHAADEILRLYPDIPALGSPFNTGNETFGLSSQYKRAAAITGDLLFHAQRRLWMQAASGAGVRAFGYHFTESVQLAILPPSLGVPHALEVVFLYGQIFGVEIPPPSLVLAVQMIDYWVSFAVSLNPSDNKGTPRTIWPQYTPHNQVLIQLNSMNLTAIPDTYRQAQISAINKVPLLFRH